MKTAKFFVPDIGESLNTLLGHPQGRFVYSNTKKRMRDLMHLIGVHKLPAFTKPVFIAFYPRTIRGKSGRMLKRYDCINFGATNKIIEDQLVKMGVLKDDSPEYVWAVICEAPREAEDGIEGIHVVIVEVDESKPHGIQESLDLARRAF